MSHLIDTSVFSGHWPFQALAYHTPFELKHMLTSYGVGQAWIAPADAVLYPDPMHGNLPMLQDVQGDPFFVPVAIIDPTIATWREDADECLHHGCRVIKLTPNYHSYTLDCPAVAQLMEFALAANMPICIQLRMVDERSHHPLMKVPAVSVAGIAALANQHIRNRFLVCAAFQSDLPRLAGLRNLWAELSNVESKETLPAAIRTMGVSQLVFGSHSPFLYFPAVAAKISAETQLVALSDIKAVAETNANMLLTGC